MVGSKRSELTLAVSLYASTWPPHHPPLFVQVSPFLSKFPWSQVFEPGGISVLWRTSAFYLRVVNVQHIVGIQ